MTDHSTPVDAVTPPSIEELDRYFLAKTQRSDCPFCGCEDWYLAEPHGGKVFSALATKTDGTLPLGAEALPMVTLVCEQCHFVRQHALKPVCEWVSSQASAGATRKPTLKRTR